MGATVDLTSQPRKGTKIVIRYTPQYVSKDNARTTGRAESPGPVRPLQVHRFHLLSLDSPESMQDIDIAGASVLELAREWLQCEVSQGQPIPKTDGLYVCAIMEQDLSRWSQDCPELLERVLSEGTAEHSRVLVIGRSIDSIYLEPQSQLHLEKVNFVHLPIGPGKLLRAIASDQASFEEPRPSDVGSSKAPVAHNTVSLEHDIRVSQYRYIVQSGVWSREVTRVV